MGRKYLVSVSCLEFSQGFRKHWRGEKLLSFPIISAILKENGKVLSEGILSAGGRGVNSIYVPIFQITVFVSLNHCSQFSTVIVLKYKKSRKEIIMEC